MARRLADPPFSQDCCRKVVDGRDERTHGFDLSSAEADVDRKPFADHRFFPLGWSRECPNELTAHGFGDADLTIEGWDKCERGGTLLDTAPKESVLGMNVLRIRHEPRRQCDDRLAASFV